MAQRGPDANWAVAWCTGPQVLDIDKPALVPESLRPSFRSCPWVRTARGVHVYFAGTQQKTVGLAYGGLRGVGSYVLIPPSVHPSGDTYKWLAEPRGQLPQAPVLLAGTERSNGVGWQV